jgi:alpha/beta superfamily hydrolase
MATRLISFPADGVTLEGLFVHPEHLPRAAGLVICHPHPLYGGDMENTVVRALADAFAATGFAVLRFNFRGVGRSMGRYSEGIGEQEDVKGALTWLATQPTVDADRLFLAGYSFGARVMLAVASADPRVHGFIAVAPPTFHGAWPSLGEERGPKVFIGGESDPYAPPEALTAWVDGLPEPRRLVILPGADHFFAGHEGTLAQHAVKSLQELS